jgi:ubiquinol-cytochrome c reductase cytochrome c1 subunit
MMKYLLLIVMLIISGGAMAEEAGIALDNAHVNLHDRASIERGAKFFATNCMACHTLVYLRYDPLAQKAGITYEKMPVNVKSWPYGITPPDLSLEADIRGADWIYTYLHSFYTDPARPTGVNNLLVPNTAMPGIIVAYQGQQALAKDVKNSQRIFGHQLQWYDMLEQQSDGILSPKDFDATITDLINFLGYAAEPYYIQQTRLGYWVIGFLIVMFVLLYLLKKEYWKDVKKKNNDETQRGK